MDDSTKTTEGTSSDQAPQVPHFLATVVTPLDKRTEMRGLWKMCSCWSFGS